MKSSAVWINSQMSNNIAHTMQTARKFSQSYPCYQVQITLKHVFIKGLNFPLNWNNFSVMFSHWHEKEVILIISFEIRSGTLSVTFFSWGRYLIKLKKCWYQVTYLVQSVIIALRAGETFSTINQTRASFNNSVLLNTCSQSRKWTQMTLTAIQNK